MKEVLVKVQSDYLQRMVTMRNPVLAVELIWNSLDAEAHTVLVFLGTNKLGGVEKIIISDDGHSIDYEHAIPSFENLGGSWKRYQTHSKGGARRLHGKRGQGWFQAFALGAMVQWHTCYKLNKLKVEYSIAGQRIRLGTFTIDDEPKQSKERDVGTIVTILFNGRAARHR